MSLPLVFYFLIKLTSDKKLMGDFANNRFQRTFAIVATVVIMTATVFTLVAAFVKF
jgi:Mn2+/Fe2+ NRAMP family transporter